MLMVKSTGASSVLRQFTAIDLVSQQNKNGSIFLCSGNLVQSFLTQLACRCLFEWGDSYHHNNFPSVLTVKSFPYSFVNGFLLKGLFSEDMFCCAFYSLFGLCCMSFLLHVIMQNLRFKSCFFRRLRQVSTFMFNMCFRGRPVRQHNFIFYCIFTIFPPSTPCKTSFWIKMLPDFNHRNVQM